MKRTGLSGRYVILNRCRQQQRLVARVTLDIRHACSIRRSADRRNRRRDFSHGLDPLKEALVVLTDVSGIQAVRKKAVDQGAIAGSGEGGLDRMTDRGGQFADGVRLQHWRDRNHIAA